MTVCHILNQMGAKKFQLIELTWIKECLLKRPLPRDRIDHLKTFSHCLVSKYHVGAVIRADSGMQYPQHPT